MHLSGSRKWMEGDVRVIWSLMSSVNLLNRLLSSEEFLR